VARLGQLSEQKTTHKIDRDQATVNLHCLRLLAKAIGFFFCLAACLIRSIRAIRGSVA
jgi:hypothetical protein